MIRYACVIALLVGGIACSPRIFGGDEVGIEEFPSTVQVESSTVGISWSQSCAGTIITNRFVISAAYCFSGRLYSNSRRRIRVGSANRESGGTVVGVARVHNHANYSSSTNEADLTIVELVESLVWSDTIQNVAIVPQDFELPSGLPVILAGWGRTRYGLLAPSSSSTLQAGSELVLSHDTCAEIYAARNQAISENMLCTGYPEDGRGACEGDEGGPVYYRDANDALFLVGVISWRESCGSSSTPGVSTRIASFTNWIVINAVV